VCSVIDLLILSQIPAIGANRLRSLVSHFGDPCHVSTASAKEISAIEGFSKKLASTVTHFFKSAAYVKANIYAERQLSKLNHAEGRILTFWDEQYPDLLKKIYDPPPFLFVKGTIQKEDSYAIGIVGTRSPSEYGMGITEKFSHEFAKLGITVVSGLARGIDTVAHTATLKQGGRTIAVIGSGLDVIYPPENKLLSEKMTAHGAVVSEYEMGAKPDAVNFPKRNRLISGLTLGTLVIETDCNGGAMITANTALDQNREVFAVPGLVTSKRSRGCHALIKEGKAKLVENVNDVLIELSTKLRPLLKSVLNEEHKTDIELSFFERNLYEVLTDVPLHIDLIAERSDASISDTLVNLLSLEFKGLIKQLPGKLFVRR
jgi:DNA processing protein